LPLDSVRKYLAARYDTRFDIAPAKLESVVASVYSDLGFTAVAVGRSGDGGIDVMLQNVSGECIGVQVKREGGKIGAEAIREFAGSLFIKGVLSGIFVTVTTYTRGAHKTAAEATKRKLPIELVDARRFFEQLGVAQRAAYDRLDDPSAPYIKARLRQLDTFSTRSHLRRW
jgi:restriction system protein